VRVSAVKLLSVFVAVALDFNLFSDSYRVEADANFNKTLVQVNTRRGSGSIFPIRRFVQVRSLVLQIIWVSDCTIVVGDLRFPTLYDVAPLTSATPVPSALA